jgi:hypothetical protein
MLYLKPGRAVELLKGLPEARAGGRLAWGGTHFLTVLLQLFPSTWFCLLIPHSSEVPQVPRHDALGGGPTFSSDTTMDIYIYIYGCIQLKWTFK